MACDRYGIRVYNVCSNILSACGVTCTGYMDACGGCLVVVYVIHVGSMLMSVVCSLGCVPCGSYTGV